MNAVPPQISTQLQTFAWERLSKMLSEAGPDMAMLKVSSKLPLRIWIEDTETPAEDTQLVLVHFCTHPSIKIREKVPFEVTFWATFSKMADDHGQSYHVFYVVPMSAGGPKGCFPVGRNISREELNNCKPNKT